MKRFVIATVIGIKGSAPREQGANILVSADESLGTIGGGKLEYQVMHAAREIIASEQPAGFSQQQNYILGTEMGQCCGGQVEIGYQLTDDAGLWQDPLQTSARKFNIVLFGAGHVGQALISILATQPCQVHWVDSRGELFPETLPANVSRYVPDTPAGLVNDMPADSYFLVMTHDHALDLEICDHVLARKDVRFLGLIGSATKAARFRSQLLRRGLEQQTVDRLTCPIGISGIGGKLPSSIAVAVVAQLVGLQERWQNLPVCIPAPPASNVSEETLFCESPGKEGLNRPLNTRANTVPHAHPLPRPFPRTGGRELKDKSPLFPLFQREDEGDFLHQDSTT